VPKSLHDWIEDDSLERFVSDLIDPFDPKTVSVPCFLEES